jgi:hypothetical protein
MTISLGARAVSFCLAALLLAACENRGTFGSDACKARGDIPDGAVAAVYVDKMGLMLGKPEDLHGTSQNKMCPLEEPTGPSGCPVGYCARTIMGKTWCLRC